MCAYRTVTPATTDCGTATSLQSRWNSVRFSKVCCVTYSAYSNCWKRRRFTYSNSVRFTSVSSGEKTCVAISCARTTLAFEKSPFENSVASHGSFTAAVAGIGPGNG